MQFGIEALTICPKKNQTEKHCNFCMMTSSFVSPSPASWVVGDYIGMESCFDLHNNEEVCGGGGGVCSESRGKREQPCTRMMMKKREFPPPIPSLARTENQPSRMPWMLKRYYTNDGRLILREEKVKYHEYFRAHRSNGRLTLHLIPVDDINEIEDIEDNDIDHEEAKEEDQINVFDSNHINYAEDDRNSSNIVKTLLNDNDIPHVIEDSLVKCSVAESTPIENGITANGGKGLNYNSVRTSPPCFLGLLLPAIRPVHS